MKIYLLKLLLKKNHLKVPPSFFIFLIFKQINPFKKQINLSYDKLIHKKNGSGSIKFSSCFIKLTYNGRNIDIIIYYYLV